MQWQKIAKLWNEDLPDDTRRWLEVAGGDMRNSRWQLERIVDCVCDRHGVARSTAELEIYKGLMRLTAGSSSAAPNLHCDYPNR